MENRSLVILLEVSPDQIRGGYLRGRLLQIAKVFREVGWKLSIGAPTSLESFEGIPCKPVRSRNLARQLEGASLALIFLSTHPHWVHSAHTAGVPVLLDASNLPWLERHEWLKRFPTLRIKMLDRVNHALMDESIRCADGVLVSHARQSEYVVSRNRRALPLEFPFLQEAPPERATTLLPLQKPYFVWGGGLWPWFDYDTLFAAIRLYRKLGGLGKLVIPVGKSEFSDFQENLLQGIEKDETLKESCILLKDWLPREAWEGVLEGAMAGICCQPNTQETRYAFRTRVLDYLRLGLPVLSTEGDSLGGLAAAANAGVLHSFGGDEELAKQMFALEKDGELRSRLSEAGRAEFAKIQAGASPRSKALLSLANHLQGLKVGSEYPSRAKTACLLFTRFLL